MKGLPVNIDLAPLSGTEAIQLRFGEHQVQIHFANESSISVESTMVLSAGAGDVRIDDYPHAASLLCRILGDRVLGATRGDDGGLLFRFESGTTLRVLNDSARYESFQVQVAGQTYVA